MPKLDNSTFPYKVALRKRALALLAECGVTSPVVCETHGGSGALFNACYAHLTEGMVFEMDSTKSAKLGKQRPTWAIYEADCVAALAGGVGSHLTFDLLDCDPYGECWNVIEAFFTSQRPFADFMVVAVNDGLRQKLAMTGGWAVKSLAHVVERRGNDLHPVYLEVCRELLTEKAACAGYRVDHFGGFYAGDKKAMTQFLAVLQKRAS